MTTQASSSSTPIGPSLFGPNVAHFLKLADSNYLLWLSQMKLFHLGHNLFGYMHGTIQAPPVTLPAPDNEPAKLSEFTT